VQCAHALWTSARHARARQAKYGFKSVLLVSDTASVFTEAAAALAPIPVVRRRGAVAAAARAQRARPLKRPLRMRSTAHRRGAISNASTRVESEHDGERALSAEPSGFERGMDFFLDLLLLSDCDGMVAKFSSGLARAAYSLMAARCERLHPFISLDQPWCFGLGCRKEGSEALKAAWRRNPLEQPSADGLGSRPPRRGDVESGASRGPARPASSNQPRKPSVSVSVHERNAALARRVRQAAHGTLKEQEPAEEQL